MKTLAFLQFQILTVLCLALSGCGAADNVEVQNDGGKKAPTIEKGTQPLSLIDSEAGLLVHTFNELGWNLRSADIAINKVSRNETEGCVQYRKISTGATFATAQFNCTLQMALNNSKTSTHRKTLVGRESYSEASDRAVAINMTSSFEQNIFLLGGGKLVGQGNTSRTLRVNRNPADRSTDYSLSFHAAYVGKVASESDRIGESWEANYTGPLNTSRATGISLPIGYKLKMVHVPERPRLEKANRTTTLELVSTSTVSFMTVPTSATVQCLRPLGNFSWTRTLAGDKESGTLSTSANGIVIAGRGNETLPWGSLCLEL